MNIFGNRVFMVGDLVQYKGRGGTKRTRENIWEIVEIISDDLGYGVSPRVQVRLVKGAINDSNNHEFGPGYVRSYFLKHLKHIEEGLEAK